MGAAAQAPPTLSVKGPLIALFRELQERCLGIINSPDGGNLRPVAQSINRSAEWFVKAAERWEPTRPGDGRSFFISVERMVATFRAAQLSGNGLAATLMAIREDITTKFEHCRRKGLAVPQHVVVITKKDGLHEVKGLRVQYIEKFFASDPNGKPYEFRKFSSPAEDDMVPGTYVIWAQETSGGSSKSGPRKEARVGTGFSRGPIEVLAP